ncbi:hypothetical protein DEU56DRAFT_837550 [Suillus clintonianus]|uniref:uncharacterized protein n=1 Tax=Suillus clintonianus TaxID=1904413 RepID=UPI001B86AE74|nr:uncharacterized protein DEU56DRAFT_837550 [Suillus clintonianus]KAG2118635.1 hypothetical protein DEU56DRAFT_837550 [Suillus clintonianus]
MLKIYKSDSGLAATFIPLFLAQYFIAGTSSGCSNGQTLRKFWGYGFLVRISAAVVLIGGIPAWWTSPVCISISKSHSQSSETSPAPDKTKDAVLGFANGSVLPTSFSGSSS